MMNTPKEDIRKMTSTIFIKPQKQNFWRFWW